MIYLTLFIEFFKIGLFAIGGGLATLPFLQDFAARTGLITSADIANMIAISESTPGPIGINSATYFGYQIGGVILVSQFLKKFKENRYVQGAFYGLRPASTGLIAAACFSVMQIALFSQDLFAQTGVFTDLFQWKHILLAVILFFVIKKTNKHPIIYLAASAVIGIVFHFAGV